MSRNDCLFDPPVFNRQRFVEIETGIEHDLLTGRAYPILELEAGNESTNFPGGVLTAEDEAWIDSERWNLF